LAFVDLEFTGLDAAKDRVVELCIERVLAGQVVDRLETLVCPGETLTGPGMKIHGIAAEEIAQAPAFAQLLPRVRALLDGAVFVAHAASYDLGFLRAEFARVGQSLDAPWVIDTLHLARRSFMFPSHSMDALCTQFGIVREAAHRAGDDVRALRQVFDRCVQALDPKSAKDLSQVRAGDPKLRDEILAQLRQAQELGQPLSLVYRPSRRGAVQLCMVVTELRSDLDPPLVIGYLLPGRGRRELRADRILRTAPHVETPSS
jgi:DNA polymerase-3 subunit epsilon